MSASTPQQIVAAQYQATGLLDFYATGSVGSVVTTTVSPDAQVPSRPGRIFSAGASSNNLDTGAFKYDGAGNIKEMSANDTFTYDTRSRLTNASLQGLGSQAYSYDPYGNMLSKAGTTFCTGSCANNRITGAGYDVRASYSTEALTYDDLSRLTRSTAPGGDFSYIYNGAGERVAKFPANVGIPRREYAHQIIEARGDTLLTCVQYFSDVPCSDNDAKYIQLLYRNGITAGFGDGTFRPDQTITRDQASVFLVKGKYCPLNGSSFSCSYTPPTCTGIFTDVPCPSQYADWIEKLSIDGVTGGCGGGQFCPSAALLTWQSLAWLSNAASPHPPYWPNYHPLPREAIITYRDEQNRVISEWQSGSGATQGSSVLTRDNAFVGSLLVASRIWSGTPTFNFFSSDHLGTPRLTTTATAAFVEARKYWPYGDDASSIGTPTGEKLKFATMERDDEASHYYDHAREHHFGLSRLLSIDLLGGDVSDPQSLNGFVYARNNPLTYRDTNGRLAELAAGIVVGAGVVEGAFRAVDYVLNTNEPTLSGLAREFAIGFGGGVTAAFAGVLVAGLTKTPRLTGAAASEVDALAEQTLELAFAQRKTYDAVDLTAKTAIGLALGPAVKTLVPRLGGRIPSYFGTRDFRDLLFKRNVNREFRFGLMATFMGSRAFAAFDALGSATGTIRVFGEGYSYFMRNLSDNEQVPGGSVTTYQGAVGGVCAEAPAPCGSGK